MCTCASVSCTRTREVPAAAFGARTTRPNSSRSDQLVGTFACDAEVRRSNTAASVRRNSSRRSDWRQVEPVEF